MTPDIDPTDDRVKDRVDFDYDDLDDLNSHQQEEVKKAQRDVEREQQQKGASMAERKRLVLKGLTAAALIVVVGLFATSYLEVDQTPTTPSGANATGPGQEYVSQQTWVGNDTDSPQQIAEEPWIGNASADVTVVEFGDFACPVCRQFKTSIYPQLKSEYIDTGEIRFVYMNFPFISASSDRAAIASECVYRQSRQGYWDYYEAIYDNQGPERQDWATSELLTRLAREQTDIDIQQFQACLSNRETLGEVQEDYRIGQNSGVTGTPTIFVNGRQLASFGFDTVSQAIENAKAR